MTQLIAYHGKAGIKEKYVQRMRAHIAADELIHGTGWEDGKGCAVLLRTAPMVLVAA